MSVDGVALNRLLPGREADYAALVDLEGVEVSAAPNAAVCGAMGCRSVEYLIRVCIQGVGRRVVCPQHAAELLREKLEGQ